MAFGKVARRTVVADVAALLDSHELAELIGELERSGDPRGRKGYGARALLGACLVKSLFALPTWTFVAALIAEHAGLQEALGGTPSVWAMYRFSVKLRKNRPAVEACLDALAASLRERHPDFGRDVAIDASDIPAWGNGHRTVYDGGPERERYSDPDASWGHRSAVGTRGAGSFFGYKIDLAVCTRTGLPLAWQARSARHHESLFPATLLDKCAVRGFKPETCAMDKGYDVSRVYAECEARGVDPVVPLRGYEGQATSPAHWDRRQAVPAYTSPLRAVPLALQPPRSDRARVRPLEARARTRRPACARLGTRTASRRPRDPHQACPSAPVLANERRVAA